MIHKISCNTEKRNENHRNNPGELKLVPTDFIDDINHEACRKKEGKSKVKLEVFFKTKNKKSHDEDLYCDKKKVDYETAINASIKKLETFFVFDIFKLFCICVFHSINIIKLMKRFVSILCALVKEKMAFWIILLNMYKSNMKFFPLMPVLQVSILIYMSGSSLKEPLPRDLIC